MSDTSESRGGLPTLRLLWALARQKTRWRLSDVMRLFEIIADPVPYRAVRSALSKAEYANFVSQYPRTPFKYLGDRYLARSLTRAARAAALAHHYKYLRATLMPAMIKRMLSGRVTLWEQRSESSVCELMLTGSFSGRNHQNEGELSIYLQRNGVELFVLSFTLVPGWVVGRRVAPHAILITRLQGFPGRREEIAQTIRALRGVRAPALLLAGVEGLGLALNAHHLACVSAADQVSKAETPPRDSHSAYDEFWTSLGCTLESGFFHLPLPAPQRPISEVNQKHRARARAKRELKAQIAAAAHATLHQGLKRNVQVVHAVQRQLGMEPVQRS